MNILKKDMDNLCNQMSSFNINQTQNVPNNSKIITDLDILIREIINKNTLNIDIYEVCVACGHDLTWDLEYFLEDSDIQWLKTHGFNRMYYFINKHIPINSLEKWTQLYSIYNRILELFEHDF